MKAVILDSLFVIRESSSDALALLLPITYHQSPITLPKGAKA